MFIQCFQRGYKKYIMCAYKCDGGSVVPRKASFSARRQQTTCQTPPSLKMSACAVTSQNREEYKNDDGTLTEYIIRPAISPHHPFPVCIRPSLCPYFNNRRSTLFSPALMLCVSARILDTHSSLGALERR